MPQSGPQATPPIVREGAASASSTTTKTKTPTVPTEVAEAFKGFLNNIFGANPVTGAPGTTTPAVVGGLPPQLTPASPLSAPPAVVPGPQAPTMPVRGNAPAGTQYGSPAAATEAGVSSFGQALVSAIESNKDKKDADNIARAQNTMNTFLHAVQQNDMYTANLYASDPKITGMWEKYLKQEYKRVPGAPTKQQATPAGDPSAGLLPSQTVPGAPGTGNVNEPGGIAIPRDMTPEGQIRQQQLAAIQESFKSMSPQQIAQTATQPGVNMDAAGLSPEEFKKFSQAKYGLALTKEQDASLDASAKIAQANAMADVYKYTVGQVSMTNRAMIAAGATTEAAKTAAASRIKVMQDHMKGLKEIQDKKGMGLTTALYQQQMKMYQQMADETQKKLANPDIGKTGALWWSNDDERKAMETERDGWLKKAEDAKAEWEGFKLIQENFPELAETPESTTPVPVEAP